VYTPQNTTGEVALSIPVNTDYVLKIVLTQLAQAYFGPDAMGQPGKASVSGTTKISFGIAIDDAFMDPALSLVYPMVTALGVAPPMPGFPPALTAIPIPVLVPLHVLALTVLLRRRRLTDAA
jgi:hypothetical protein